MSHAGLPRRARIAVLCASLGAALPVYAELDSAALLGHYTFADDARAADDHGYGGRLVLSFPLSPRVTLEPSLYGDYIGRKGGDSDAVIGLGADVRYSLLTLPHFEPYLLAGGGAEYERTSLPDGSKAAAPFVSAGAGVLVPLVRNVGLRLEARDTVAFNSGSYTGAEQINDIRVGLGVQYHFGNSRPLAFLDRSHETPEPVAKACCEVIDTAAAAANGVPTALCPTPPAGFVVDAEGCLVAQTATLPAVSFNSSTAKLAPAALPVLNQLAETLIQEPDIGVEVGGHTDASGSQEKNLLLSQQRARVVADYLIERGVAPERVRAEGYGSFKPVTSNATPKGRAQNRRVEFKLTRG